MTQTIVAANGGKPITVPDVETFDASGNFTPTTFNVSDYVPGIGNAPRPFRLSTEVKRELHLISREDRRLSGVSVAKTEFQQQIATFAPTELGEIIAQQISDRLKILADIGAIH